MSEQNLELKLRNKSSSPNSRRSSLENEENEINKSNPRIESEPKHKEFQEDEKIEKNDISNAHSNSNIEKIKPFISTHYEPESKWKDYRANLNELPPLLPKKSMEEKKFSRTYYKNEKVTVKTLKKKVRELSLEINKLRNNSNVQNYNILELNYKQKSKELTELKQENNFIRFQLEDLIRKNSKNKNNVKNNNFINKNNNNNGNNKKPPVKLGDICDFHNKFFLQKIKIEENNKEKNYEKDIKNEMLAIKNEDLKKKIEAANKEIEKYKKMLNTSKNENDELKSNIQKLNNRLISIRNEQDIQNLKNNNNEKFDKNALNRKILELNEEKNNLKNELNNIRKTNDKNKNAIIEENNKNKKEIIELKKKIEQNKEISNKEKDKFTKEINELKKKLEENKNLSNEKNKDKEAYTKQINELKKIIDNNKESNTKEKDKYIKEINELKKNIR